MTIRHFIDLADAMNYEYILIDALWDENLGRDKLAELVGDARDKGKGDAANDQDDAQRHSTRKQPGSRRKARLLVLGALGSVNR